MVDHPSFDDFYVLLEGHSLDEAASWAEGVRARIFSETALRCSAGVARTKLLSLLATKKGKPNGQWLCRAHSEERTLLDDVRVDAMRGAGIVGIRPASRQAILEALIGRAGTKGGAATVRCSAAALHKKSFEHGYVAKLLTS